MTWKTRFQTLRRAFPLLLGAALFALGVAALYHLLRPVDPADVAAQLRSTPISVLAAALAATFAGYAALVFYDWFGLRLIGRSLGPGVVALGGFLGYAFGNTIGVSVVSGGAVRYRVYSAAGLTSFEVAVVSGYVALAFGAGLTLAGLASVALRPAAVAPYLPYEAATTSVVAGALVVAAVGVMVWLSASRRRLRLGKFELRFPVLQDLGGQLIATLVDILAASFALWILLPAGKPDFASFIAVYAAAAMLGVLSHVPGGVGVFETVVIGALPPTVSAGDAAAALLLFRLVYFLVPFALAFLLLALNEAQAAGWLGRRLLPRAPLPRRAMETLRGFSPGLVAVVAFGFGVYLLLVTMIPSVRSAAIADDDVVGVLLLEGGTLASAVAGGSLLILSHGLARRVSSAYWLAIFALSATAGAFLLNDLDIENAALLCLGAGALLPFRRAFDRPGRLTLGVFEPRWFVTIIGVGLATAAFFLFVHKAVPYSNDLWTEFSPGSGAPRALRGGLAATALLIFFGVHILARPVRRKPSVDADPRSMAQAAALAEGALSPQAWLSQTGDKRFLFSESGDAFIMYAARGASWVALGDPVGDPRDFAALCWSFTEQAAQANCRPVFYEISERSLPLLVELGLSLHKVGEEAVIRLPDFSLSGARFKSMRSAANKRRREGYELAILPPPHDAGVIARLREISDAWLSARTGREKGFSVGRFDPRYLDLFDIAVVRYEGRIVGFANIMSTCGGRYLGVDLMRYPPEEAAGLMEYMFLCLIDHFRQRGAEEFSLGVAPLAGLSERSVAHSWNRFGRLIYRHGGALYQFEGLRAFKQKFHPDWRPRYVALPPHVSPVVAMGDVALLIAGDVRSLVAKRPPRRERILTKS